MATGIIDKTPQRKPDRLIHSAALTGDKGTLQKILKDPRITVEEVDKFGRTPLMLTVLADQIECAEVLLKNGANVDTKDKRGRTALHWATYKGLYHFCALLISRGAYWREKDQEDVTTLHLATKHEDTRCLALILKELFVGEEDEQDINKRTALHWSASYGNFEAVSMLIKQGSNIGIPDKDGKTPLHWAATAGDSPKAIATMQLILDTEPSVINWQDYEGRTALHLAVAQGSLRSVETLVNFHTSLEQCNVSVLDNMFRTPLHWAANLGHKDVVNLLLDKNASYSSSDSNGATALHYAAQNNHLDTVKAFLSREGMTDEPDLERRTALMWAAGRGADSVVRVMMSHQADINATDKTGSTALHAAAMAGHASTIDILLELGADVNAKDENKHPPLFRAAEMGQTDALASLIKGGASVNVTDDEGRSPLHWAARGGHSSVCSALLQNGINPNIQDNHGRTPLQCAAYGGFIDCMNVLLIEGADPDLTDQEGVTSLHYACSTGYMDAVRQLLKHNAFINHIELNEDCYTPLDHALLNGHFSLAQFMLEQGALSINTIRDLAASRIQANFRGYSVRKTFLERKLLLVKHEELRKNAVERKKSTEKKRRDETGKISTERSLTARSVLKQHSMEKSEIAEKAIGSVVTKDTTNTTKGHKKAQQIHDGKLSSENREKTYTVTKATVKRDSDQSAYAVGIGGIQNDQLTGPLRGNSSSKDKGEQGKLKNSDHGRRENDDSREGKEVMKGSKVGDKNNDRNEGMEKKGMSNNTEIEREMNSHEGGKENGDDGVGRESNVSFGVSEKQRDTMADLEDNGDQCIVYLYDSGEEHDGRMEGGEDREKVGEGNSGKEGRLGVKGHKQNMISIREVCESQKDDSRENRENPKDGAQSKIVAGDDEMVKEKGGEQKEDKKGFQEKEGVMREGIGNQSKTQNEDQVGWKREVKSGKVDIRDVQFNNVVENCSKDSQPDDEGDKDALILKQLKNGVDGGSDHKEATDLQQEDTGNIEFSGQSGVGMLNNAARDEISDKIEAGREENDAAFVVNYQTGSDSKEETLTRRDASEQVISGQESAKETVTRGRNRRTEESYNEKRLKSAKKKFHGRKLKLQPSLEMDIKMGRVESRGHSARKGRLKKTEKGQNTGYVSKREGAYVGDHGDRVTDGYDVKRSQRMKQVGPISGYGKSLSFVEQEALVKGRSDEKFGVEETSRITGKSTVKQWVQEGHGARTGKVKEGSDGSLQETADAGHDKQSSRLGQREHKEEPFVMKERNDRLISRSRNIHSGIEARSRVKGSDGFMQETAQGRHKKENSSPDAFKGTSDSQRENNGQSKPKIKNGESGSKTDKTLLNKRAIKDGVLISRAAHAPLEKRKSKPKLLADIYGTMDMKVKKQKSFEVGQRSKMKLAETKTVDESGGSKGATKKKHKMVGSVQTKDAAKTGEKEEGFPKIGNDAGKRSIQRQSNISLKETEVMAHPGGRQSTWSSSHTSVFDWRGASNTGVKVKQIDGGKSTSSPKVKGKKSKMNPEPSLGLKGATITLEQPPHKVHLQKSVDKV